MENLEKLKNTPPYLILITGASGAGKTTTLEAIKKRLSPHIVSVNYFDSIGVPSLGEMIQEYGSGEKWQEAMTHSWIEKLANIKDQNLIFLEGQFNPDFAISHLRKLNIDKYVLICLYADKEERERRLINLRNQKELATSDMENWSNVLKIKTSHHNGIIIDSTKDNPDAIASYIMNTILNVIYLKEDKEQGNKA